jgi:hypothetical protein
MVFIDYIRQQAYPSKTHESNSLLYIVMALQYSNIIDVIVTFFVCKWFIDLIKILSSSNVTFCILRY